MDVGVGRDLAVEGLQELLEVDRAVTGVQAADDLEELVAIAARLFVTRGYSAASMQEIADEMGILKGSVYHYVRTKEDLLWMIVEPRLTTLVEQVRAVFDDEDVPILDRIRTAIEFHTARFEADYPYMVVITQENGDTISAPRRKAFTKLRDEHYGVWKTAIAEGLEDGRLRDDLDVSITVQAVFGMINWMFRWYHPDGRLSSEQIGAEFSKMVLAGIAAEPTTATTTRRRQRRSNVPARD